MSNTLIVEQGPNPSTDFFILPHLREHTEPCLRFGFGTVPSAAELEGARLIFVRYVPPKWRRLLEQSQDKPAEIVFFMDDDLFDRRAFADMPLRYQWKLWSLACRHQSWLARLGARLWVSTPYLAQKYAHWRPEVLEPGNPYEQESSASLAVKTLFYHGSASHYAELEWLEPVVEQALSRCPELTFEVIGDRHVRDRFAHLARVHVLHPMQWPAYQALLRRPGRTIGLAPLLDSPFNAARAPTKFFDITQAGAVGLYARGPIYERLVSDGINGRLLPMDKPDAWVDAIEHLLTNEPERVRMLAEARKLAGQRNSVER